MIKATENKIRLTAFWVFILVLLFIESNFILIPIFLAIDFFLRAFGYGKFSILGNLSLFVSKFLKLKEVGVFFPPKQFAAKIGFVFSLLLIILNLLTFNSLYISLIFIFFAALEAFFNICAGCYVYNFYHTSKSKF